MPKKMSAQRELEYSELCAYLDFYFTHVRGIDPTDVIHPTNVLSHVLAEHGKSKALEGLKQAVNDTMEMLQHQPAQYISRLDNALRGEGIITVSELRRRYTVSYQRILKRKKISSETEYYIITAMLADPSSMSVNDQCMLDQLVDEYEKRVLMFMRPVD